MKSLRDLIVTRLPYSPYCTDNLQKGLYIRAADTAAKAKYLQLNPPMQQYWLLFDIDWAGASAKWEDANLAPPNWITVNPKNAHAHYGYLLDVPIITGPKGRIEPIRYAAAVEAAYALKLHADPGYSGLIAKNPLHASWRTWYLHDHAYSLAELAEWAQLHANPTAELKAEGGRNVRLFDSLREWAYGMVLHYKNNGVTSEMWKRAVAAQAAAMNRLFDNPLPESEVRALVKSVSKWTWLEFNQATFSEIQRKRALLRWTAEGNVPAERAQPWIEMGISRRTYYYRKNRGMLRS